MAKRKLKQNQKASDDEVETQRPMKQLKKQKKSISKISVKNVSFSSNEGLNSSMGRDMDVSFGNSDFAPNDSYYESFSSFMKAFSFDSESDGEHQKFKDISHNIASDFEISTSSCERRKSIKVPTTDSSHENSLEEESEPNVMILSVPSKLTEVVLLPHPSSCTLHGYVEVSVCLGSVNIHGYKVKEGENVRVFSTEGTGLKKVTAMKSVHKSSVKHFKRKLSKIIGDESIDIEEFIDKIGPTAVVLIVKKLLLPAPLKFLELYYPNALQLRWPKNEEKNEKKFELCSKENNFTIDITDSFKAISREVTKAIRQTAEHHGPRIFVTGNKNMGKSTLLRYLMNSSLNKHPVVYFLDTDPGQTEYTPPGVVSLFRVTKPLLGPPFAHQKKPLRMIFIGSVTPGTCPTFYDDSINCLIKYFDKNFHKETLFVNTMGWNKGVGALCIQKIKEAVKPTIMIEIVPPEPNLSLTKFDDENGTLCFTVPSEAPSRESAAPSYNSKELRNFSIVAYLGQCQESYMPVTLINSFHPVCVCWDKIALHVMGKKIPPLRLVEAMHCSIVALCHVDLSYILTNDDPAYPITLSNDPICECLGFGLIRASDETNHVFYIVTPLQLDQLKNVNALIKGNIMIPDEIILKQAIENVPLPFTDHSHAPKTPASKTVRKRAFFRT